MGSGMLLTADRPTSAIISVSSDSYPAESAGIKKVFLAAQKAPIVGYPYNGTFTIQHPGNLGRRPKQKKVWLSSCYYVFKEKWT